MNVLSLGTRWTLSYIYYTDTYLFVGITETWLSNDANNNMPGVNTCLESGYTLHHRPRTTGRGGGGGAN